MTQWLLLILVTYHGVQTPSTSFYPTKQECETAGRSTVSVINAMGESHGQFARYECTKQGGVPSQ